MLGRRYCVCRPIIAGVVMCSHWLALVTAEAMLAHMARLPDSIRCSISEGATG